MRLKLLLVGVSLMLLAAFRPALVFAAEGYSTAGHITLVEQELIVHGVWIITDTAIYNDNCPGSPGEYFLPDDAYPGASNTKFKQDLSLVMAAYMSGRTVSFDIKNCSYVGSPLIASVRIN
jgi:hypothetical protein